MKKVALITGANRGLGFETARQLAEAGATTIIGARDPAKGEQAAQQLQREGLDAEAIAIDVDDASIVEAAAKWVQERHGHLDILVNNAGIAPETSSGDAREIVDADMFRRTFETNVFGAVAVIQWFLPLLRTARSGRIVNVSTTMGSLSEQLNRSSPYFEAVVPAYQSSKAALNGITVALSKLLADTPIKVNSVCPGFVKTDITPINRAQAPLSAEEAAWFVVEMAVLDDDGPTGRFVDRDGPVSW